MTLPPISDNLAQVCDRIADGRGPCRPRARRHHPRGRDQDAPGDFVDAALAAGQLDFGENRPEEAHDKFIDHPRTPRLDLVMPPRLHLIGPIQSRKAPSPSPADPALIHSIDRLKIARKLSELAADAGLRLDVLFEVNVVGEASKSGFSPGRSALRPARVARPALACVSAA